MHYQEGSVESRSSASDVCVDMASVQTVKGSTISFHNLKYTVQVKPPGKCCANSEGKEIIHSVRLVKSMVFRLESTMLQGKLELFVEHGYVNILT